MHENILSVIWISTESDNKRIALTMHNLLSQNLVSLCCFLPEALRDALPEDILHDHRICFPKNDRPDTSLPHSLSFLTHVLTECRSEYVLCVDAKVKYTKTAMRNAIKELSETGCDFVSTQIAVDEKDLSPVYLQSLAVRESNLPRTAPAYLSFDSIIGNKFFRASFLREMLQRSPSSIGLLLKDSFRYGYYEYSKMINAILFDDEEHYPKLLEDSNAEALIASLFRQDPITLHSSSLIPDRQDVLCKLYPLREDTNEKRMIKRYTERYLQMPLQNQVLFISARKDDRLDSNMAALYDHVGGKKTICSKTGQHSLWTRLNMWEQILTSRIIVTDDYCRYLRNIPLRPSQKVLQIWHACGAFKKFGQRGTPFSTRADLSYHSQYNLVCVSGDFVRKMYADAFDIPINRVRALGVPRTDLYYDKAAKERIRAQIYEAHPEFIDHYLIIYAPTFRDTGGDRTTFCPPLDYDRLSVALKAGELFVICPHPIMKNPILPKAYKNILEIRDISTNDMMFVSDLMITDYSSVIFEYSLLGKPMAFYCYDSEEYDRGFYLRYPEDLPGEMFTEQEDLIRYLTDRSRHKVSDQADIFRQKYMSACDGHSGQRIGELINDYLLFFKQQRTGNDT